MFADLLICVFSYNRGEFLQNLLNSIRQFYPDAHLAVFDDGSDDPVVKNIINQLPIGTHVHINNSHVLGCEHGGLYKMMNVAIEHAKSNSYKYAYFVQDDMQFLWRDEALKERLASIFRRDDCMMCNANFLLKIFSHKSDNRVAAVGADLYRFEQHGVADTGIINLEKARVEDLRFLHNAEKANGLYWYNKGFRMYWLPASHLAWLPWPKVYRYKRAGREKVHALRLKSHKVQQIKNNTAIAFAEDYAATKTWVLRPYWCGADLRFIDLAKIYIKYYLRISLTKK